MSISTHIIATNDLTRDFKQTRAVNSLDLEVHHGELFGLVGPDGAGKTTVLRLLAGLLYITEGSATVTGFDLKTESESIKARVGYMAQEFNLYGELTVAENLRFFSELYDVEPNVIHERTERLLDFAGLKEFTSRRAAHLSGGMKKKLALACTLIHEPPLLLLDEPTTGVDPISRREFWDILTELYLGGTTIVVSTPYMDEADRCSRVGLMYEGAMIVCDTPQNIRSQIQGDLIELKSADWRRAKEILQKLPGVLEIQTYGESLHILVDSEEKRLASLEKTLAENNVTYRGLRRAPIRMEEAFLSLITHMDIEQKEEECES
jgi:ABC-2 type transport system ATP-binding protein